MVMKHQDDDGDLSIIASGSGLLFACSKGHYWRIQVNQADAHMRADQPFEQRATVTNLVDEFGEGVMRALGDDT